MQKHVSQGLTATYKKSAFAPKKFHMRKVKKVLVSLIPPPQQHLPAVPPALPERLGEQLYAILLNPPPAGSGAMAAASLSPHELWSHAAEACVALALVSGSLTTLVQLPRAVYLCKASQHAVREPPPDLCRRCAPPGARASAAGKVEYWVAQAEFSFRPQAGAAPPDGAAPAASDEASAEDGAVVPWPAWRPSPRARGLPSQSERIPLFGGHEGGRRRERRLRRWRRRRGRRLPDLHTVVTRMVELSANGSCPAPLPYAGQQVTPQQVTEMWQPLGVELRRDTLLVLVSLCVELLHGERKKREIVAAICALRLLTVHLQLFDRCRVDLSELLPDRPASPGAAETLRSQLLNRLFSILMLPASKTSAQIRPLWERMQFEAVCAIVGGMGAFFPTHEARAGLLLAAPPRTARGDRAGRRDALAVLRRVHRRHLRVARRAA